MALVYAKVKDMAERIKDVCDLAKRLNREITDVLAQNSHLSIDWGAQSKPSYINEDVAANLDGLTFSRQQISNAVGSLDTLKTTLADGHLGNINQVADPDA